MEIFLFFDLVLLVMTFTYRKSYRTSNLWVCFLVLLVLMGLQDGQTDSDYPHYLSFFTGKGYSMYGTVDSPETYNLEWPYFYYCKLLTYFGRSEELYILAYFMVVAIPWLLIVRKESANPPLSLFLLLTLFRSWTFLFFSTVHRQMIATTFLFIAYLIYKSDIKYKYVFIVALLALSMLGHSTMMLIVPLMLVIMLVKYPIPKKYYLIILGISAVLGMILIVKLAEVFQDAMGMVAQSGVAERTTDYLDSEEEQYQLMEGGKLWAIIPTTLVTLVILAYSSKKELTSFAFKMLFWGNVIYNLFSFVPLSNRIVTALLLFGIAGAIPEKMQTDRRCRLFMGLAMVVNLYFAYRYYVDPDFRLVYHTFIQ